MKKRKRKKDGPQPASLTLFPSPSCMQTSCGKKPRGPAHQGTGPAITVPVRTWLTSSMSGPFAGAEESPPGSVGSLAKWTLNLSIPGHCFSFTPPSDPDPCSLGELGESWNPGLRHWISNQCNTGPSFSFLLKYCPLGLLSLSRALSHPELVASMAAWF